MADALARVADAIAQGGAPSSDFDLNKDVVLPEGRTLRAAAVLAAILPGAKGQHELILTKRSSA